MCIVCIFYINTHWLPVEKFDANVFFNEFLDFDLLYITSTQRWLQLTTEECYI